MIITMKKTILFFATLLAQTVGCQRAEDLSPDVPVFKEVAVNIGENGDETRSLISIEAEDFKKASLFAFYHSTGEIAVYPESAGDQVGTGPVAIEVTEKQFNWALPVGQALDIYVIVNYGDELGTTMEGYRGNANLTESTLDALKFTVLDNVYMSDVEASGIPMSGVVHTTLANENSPLNVTVKRLFAKYVLKFDLCDLTTSNASLQALHIVTENVNTEVPFFQDNFKQTVRSKFKEYDRASDLDLEQIQSGQPIVLYVPENCQGSISNPIADKWYNVQGFLGSKVVNCTYVDLAVKIVDAEGCWKNYNAALYLGSDCRTNFDVVRNVSSSITVKIPYVPPIIEGQDYFYFDNHDLVTVNGGEDATLGFTTSLDHSTEVSFTYTDAASGEVVGDAFTVVTSSGRVKLTANSNYVGHRFTVTGGSALKNAQDQKPVEIVDKAIVLEDMEITCHVVSHSDLDSRDYTFEGDGRDMNVHVDMNDGNECDLQLTLRVKYDGEWHSNLPSTDPLVQIWITGMGADVPQYRIWGTKYSDTEWYMPGDVDVVKVYFNNEVVMSFSIYYN